MKEPQLYIADADSIRSGAVTDIYFVRTRQVLAAKGLCDTYVRAELHAYSLPRGYEWAVFAGLEEALAILRGRRVNVYAMPEGTLFKPMEPLMVIEGPYCEFAELETAILGVLRHETSIATKAARIRLAAGDRTVLFFGLRALHPAIAPMADRAAYIGGCDGVSGIMSERFLGVKPTGTMPHALIIVFGDQVKAWKAFDEVVDETVPRIALTDTFYDERVEALMAAKALGSRLYGVRLDTPSSRRGNMRKIVQEVRWTLDINGFRHVKIFVSGGLDEDEVRELRDIVDGFGVGTSIAFPPSIDISMDIVEVRRGDKWEPIAKRGKLPGFKQVYRCRLLEDYIVPWDAKPPSCPDGSKPKPLLEKVMENGEIIKELPTVHDIRSYVLEQLRAFSQ
ncbi:nicotinate phosphoribosyltransferase [Hyperthermus butylicus]|uniref:nicotinate phosphoribosyltransferase n=1 Tax=Hyperthermus butylicus (strain DSM 5456 / JCM 9403 / PLM1-5) TaxID=415426 RepID=A2BLV3_HYPBU|nr:nicotinate phosphoribosyltransferase [Hyperthermus butylicus]ABM80964.1 putative Nicotinic acid phosphoribosyltransferase [Hyperthermus butylicus DSM 5456]